MSKREAVDTSDQALRAYNETKTVVADGNLYTAHWQWSLLDTALPKRASPDLGWMLSPPVHMMVFLPFPPVPGPPFS